MFFHSVYVEYGDSLMLRVHLCPRGGVHVVLVLVSALFYDEFVVFVIDEFAFGVCFVGCGLERQVREVFADACVSFDKGVFA